jgi:hypothetical protein
MDGLTVLVSASGSDTDPAVQLRDSGDMWLIASLRRPIGQRLSSLRPGQIGLPRERRALGGCLPAGAVAVEVVTAAGEHLRCAVGNGAWVVVVDDATCDEFNVPVLYYDGTGALVVPPFPTDWPRMPVMDTDVTCPGCGIVAWDQVVPPGNWHTSSGRNNAPAQPPVVVVCRRCGHEERRSGRYVRVADDSRDSPSTGRDTSPSILAALAPFPIYMVDGLAGRVVGASRASGTTTRVTVTHETNYRRQHGQLTVQTEPTSSRLPMASSATLARRALAKELVNPRPRPTCSDAAAALMIGADRRHSHRVALGRPTSLQRITVGSESVELEYVAAEAVWAGIARTDAVQITLTGNGYTPEVRLRQLETKQE